MARGRAPQTHAFGRMDLLYGATGELHRCSFWLNDDLSPSAALARATAIADVMKGITAHRYSIVSYAYTPYGQPTTPFTPLAAPIQGLIAQDQYPDSKSYELSFSGRGHPTVVGDAYGKARICYFVGCALRYQVGRKAISGIEAPEVAAVIALLNDSSIGVVNIYGQSATFYPQATVAFNETLEQSRGT